MKHKFIFASYQELVEVIKTADASFKEMIREWIVEIHQEAMQAAYEEAKEYYDKHGDRDLCGFAWVTSYCSGNSFVGRVLRNKCQFKRSYSGGYTLWNPSHMGYQSVNILEKGAAAYVETFRKYIPGISMYAGSRLD